MAEAIANTGVTVGEAQRSDDNEQTTTGLKKATSDLNNQLGVDKIKGFVIDLPTPL